MFSSSRSLISCSLGWPNKSQLHIVTSTSVILLGFCSRLTDHRIPAQQKAPTLCAIMKFLLVILLVVIFNTLIGCRTNKSIKGTYPDCTSYYTKEQILYQLRARLLTGLFSFWSYRAFLLGAAFFCAELFFFVGLFFRGLAFFFEEAFIQLNLRLVNYLLMAAGYFLPIFPGCPFRNDNCKDMPIMVNMTEVAKLGSGSFWKLGFAGDFFFFFFGGADGKSKSQKPPNDNTQSK